MRRALALAPVIASAIALAAAGTASAETWTKFFTMENGADVSYDKDYTYRDRQSGRLVIMQALSKGTLGPSAPGKADSVGSVVALDCSNKNLLTLGNYRPNTPFDVKATWRLDTPKKATGADNEALFKEICPNAGSYPSK